MSLFWGDGGGQKVYQNVLIFMTLFRRGREGIKGNKSNVFLYSLFLMASLKAKTSKKQDLNMIFGFKQFLFSMTTKDN